ncbi:hypothetical protein B0O99DRAFT_620579 [Bisporella sp. PMI_857]|nr:hypothetical protein B0O99DRAFT_620579 [Bisporella sp. PMI_857]
MDVAYNQHSPHSRHNSRSSTNLNHLTLAPLTSRLPLSDQEDLPDQIHMSYIEGRSAPTTPSILSSSPSHVRKLTNSGLPKSKSSTHLLHSKQPRPGSVTPGGTKPKRREELSISSLSAHHRNDSDWLLRAGATIATSTRESKGQAWLVSRASSTSLSAQQDEDNELYQHEQSQGGSRRGSADADDEFSPVTTRRSLSFGPPSAPGSRPVSRYGSRVTSRRGSRSHIYTPAIHIPGVGQEKDGYFNHKDISNADFMTEPDFVGIEDEENADEDGDKADEDVVRKLARANSLGFTGWVERMLGWSLFAVDEDGEETEVETVDEKGNDSEVSSKSVKRTAERLHDAPEGMPPLNDEEAGGWQDAAWLLSVATKVLL